MASLNWTDQSIADLTNIADFIAKDSAKYAQITVHKIRAAAKQLRHYPLSGRRVPETDVESIRELIIGNYRLVYPMFSPDRNDVLTVHHSARQLDTEELKKHMSM